MFTSRCFLKISAAVATYLSKLSLTLCTVLSGVNKLAFSWQSKLEYFTDVSGVCVVQGKVISLLKMLEIYEFYIFTDGTT
jgi:hypothetical protein